MNGSVDIQERIFSTEICTYLYFHEKHITGFKHKYPYIEFSRENPKKTELLKMSVCVQTDIDVVGMDDC